MENPTRRSYILAMKISTELTMEICYKLRIIGVTIDGTYQILGDNESTLTSCSTPYTPPRRSTIILNIIRRGYLWLLLYLHTYP